ncbi:hypothetical protein ACWCQQ_08125 [Streptomyces sp. NPDC002143]
MARDIKGLDADLVKAEEKIRDILLELGSVPTTQYPTVLFRLLKLENDSSKLTTDVAATNTAVAELKNKFKEYRWMVIGLVAGLQLFKVDIQAFKLDITLLKEWKRNDVAAGLKNSTQYMKATYDAGARAAVKDEFKKRYESATKRVHALYSKQARDALKAEKDREKDKAKEQAKAAELSSLRSHLDPVYLLKSKEQEIDIKIKDVLGEANRAHSRIDDLVNKLRAAGQAGTPKAAPSNNNQKNQKNQHSKNNRNNQNNQGNQATKKELAELKSSVTALSQALAGI